MVKIYTVGKQNYTMEEFLDVVRILRAPDGCPWDREQTHKTLRNNLLEEAYEAADAIDTNDNDALCEELGDVLLQVAMHAQIASENGSFNIDDIVSNVSRKLVYRHPHVFGDVEADTSEKVLDNWDKLKRTEKNQSSYTDTLTAVPKAFPSLLRAGKVQKRAGKAGFDWDDVSGALPKIKEEADELEAAVNNNDTENIFEELGDLLFAVVNVSRFLKVDPEEALAKATDKFISRFKKVEDAVNESGRDMKELSLNELDKIWEDVKK